MSNAVTISFDPRDLEQCKRALFEISLAIAFEHDDQVSQELFSKAVVPKSFMKKFHNARLMVGYIRRCLVRNDRPKPCRSD